MEFELERDTFNPLYPPILPDTTSTSGLKILSTDGLGHAVVNNNNYTGPDPDIISSPSTPRRDSSDSITTLSTSSANTKTGSVATPDYRSDLDEQDDWQPSAEDILESTTSHAKPIPALERLRKIRKAKTASTDFNAADYPTSPEPRARNKRFSRGEVHARVGMMDVFAIMSQINEQLGAATSLDTFLKVAVGVIKDLTQFHRVMVYQFDEVWNGQVVAELVDWSQTRDLYRGLHFPASDIPAQARALYSINKVRLLYDRSQVTARIVARSKGDLDIPLDMTHCYLRAMSPIHIKYLANMGVRASMSISIMAFGTLWGLVTCHSYGGHGMRVSFPVRQMLRLLSQSISRNIERLSYAKRLHTRKLINTVASDRHPTGYIINNADDLLSLFDADFGILVIGEGAKILGPNQHGQEILIMAEYLRLKQFNTIQASQAVTKDFPDLELTAGFEIIAGLLHVPLSSGGKDFVALLRKGQPRHVRWAGKPYPDVSTDRQATLEPRKSFKTWSETVIGRCRAWTDEQLETAGVLALIFGKFIEVWRQKESALQTTKLTNLLLSNASHEVRTPLNHIINYLEMALDGALDGETRDNLSRSHAASKGLLFTINDLLDLTRLERGNVTSFDEPFDLQDAIYEATRIYRREAERRNVSFFLQFEDSPKTVVGDAKKIRTVVQNLTGNSLKYTDKGSITVRCSTFDEPEGLRDHQHTAVEIVVTDTGCGIQPDTLEHIFREFEQVESSEQKPAGEAGVGLGLAVVARIVEQLGGQLRVESEVDEGSRFSFLIPLALPIEDGARSTLPSSGHTENSLGGSIAMRSRKSSQSSEFECVVEALTSNHMFDSPDTSSPRFGRNLLKDTAAHLPLRSGSAPGTLELSESQQPLGPVKSDNDLNIPTTKRIIPPIQPPGPSHDVDNSTDPHTLRILIVEDDKINRTILAKRLRLNGHTVVNTTNGQEGFDAIASDRSFDAVLMDIQMPILNGFEAAQKIRNFEISENSKYTASVLRLSHQINGRIPIFAVSASLTEPQRYELLSYGMDGWILKPINFHRLHVILAGVTDPIQRRCDIYRPGYNWEAGGWLRD